jgi:hypothetical protein
MMSVVQSVERVTKETEVLAENLLQFRCVYHKSHMSDLDSYTGTREG